MMTSLANLDGALQRDDRCSPQGVIHRSNSRRCLACVGRQQKAFDRGIV